MVHKLGNSTKCRDCFFYTPKDEEKGDFEGYCSKGLRVNGAKIRDVAEVRAFWGSGCQDWEDRETRITHFEAMTREPDPKRTPAEAEYIRKLLRGEKEIYEYL